MITFTPLYHRLLVQREAVDDVSKGGIVIPDTAKEKPDRGVVVAAGEGRIQTFSRDLAPLTVQVGDRVVFSKYAGTEVSLDNKDLIVLSEDDVLAIVSEEEEEVEESE